MGVLHVEHLADPRSSPMEFVREVCKGGPCPLGHLLGFLKQHWQLARICGNRLSGLKRLHYPQPLVRTLNG